MLFQKVKSIKGVTSRQGNQQFGASLPRLSLPIRVARELSGLRVLSNLSRNLGIGDIKGWSDEAMKGWSDRGKGMNTLRSAMV
jgi:hypothetical protein